MKYSVMKRLLKKSFRTRRVSASGEIVQGKQISQPI